MASILHLESLVADGDPPVRVMPAFHTYGFKHSHDFYELVYVTDGYCLHQVENLCTLIMEGDIFILPPGIQHGYTGNRVTHIYNCIFSLSALGDSLADLVSLPGLHGLFSGENEDVVQLHLNLPERKTILKSLQRMEEALKERPLGWQITLKSHLVSLMVEYARACVSRVDDLSNNTVYPVYVRNALAVIDAQYANSDLSVRSIASRVGVSEDYLTRQFRLVTGVTTLKYLRRYRFARAMELLQSGMNVSDVAESVGFHALSYFSREFSKELGVSPSRYREQSRKGEF